MAATSILLERLLDAWSNRFRIDVIPSFTSEPRIGNTILIANLSGNPITLYSLAFFYKEGNWPRTEKRYIWSTEEDLMNLRIEPSDSRTLTFAEADHFSWQGRKIFVELHFVGRKPFVKKLQ